jgi:hypothetical protein
MDERDERPFGARSWLLVDEPNTPLSQMAERRTNVIHPQRDVMQARTAALEKTGDWRLRRSGFEQFERSVSDRHEMRTDVLGLDFFRSVDVEAKAIAKERKGRPNIAYRDPDMVENDFHYSGQWSVVCGFSIFSRISELAE